MIEKSKWQKCYKIAELARSKGLDPENFVEITPAPDLAARVEGIVGPEGVADYIRSIAKNIDSTEVAFKTVAEIVDGRFGKDSKEKLVEQAIRTGTAIITEGILVAPTEGISQIKIKKNQDGTEYLAVYYSGPIRAAGGTPAAQSVLLADYARIRAGIGEFRPTETNIARYAEDVDLYHLRGARLQYKPPEADLKWIVKNCPVCVDGEPTEEYEVGIHRDVPGVETNRLRGGMCLVLCEGIAQKAPGVLATSKKFGLDWDWLEKIIKVPKSQKRVTEIEPNTKFLDDSIAGRPIFAYPSRRGGFRLRYGRTRISGFMAKGVHPATMIILDSFLATGTQMKVERPPKGCVVVPCDTIEPPVVKLEDGSVVRVETESEARNINHKVQQILFLGDILISFGDFAKRKEPLAPAGYCEEWWVQEVEKAAEEKKIGIIASVEEIPSAEEAFDISKKLDVPLHPKYTFFWRSINGKEVKELINWLKTLKVEYEWFKLKEISMSYTPAKNVLEKLLIPHGVDKDKISVASQDAYALLRTLDLLNKGDKLEKHAEKLIAKIDDDEDGLDAVNKLSEIKIKDKIGTWIGAKMGRPEKSKERKMKPPVHVLFPISNAAGKTRNIMKAYNDSKSDQLKHGLTTNIARRKCRQCGDITFLKKCDKCKIDTFPELICLKCGKISHTEEHSCGGRAVGYDERPIDIVKHVNNAIMNTRLTPNDVKGIIKLMSKTKIPEPLEKGFFRAKHDVFVFKDGTSRVDATNVPITHFYPREIGATVEKLKEMGYEKDTEGRELVSEDQLIELKTQDLIVSERGIDYLVNVSKFIDDELVHLYKQEPYYNAKNRNDILGSLIILLSPHTSCGVLSRVIGVTKAHVCYGHPYLFAATRRDADGDEDAVMLLMDGLLNFSKKFLPSTRGGTMDASVVLMTNLDPKEIDDQVHLLEVIKKFPLEFYEATQKIKFPKEVKIEMVEDRLGTDRVNHDLFFTHNTTSINAGVIETTYVTLKSMREKIDAQLNLGEKIMAVDHRNAAERIILSHFLPDLYGNLRAFSKQTVRCVECNKKYRRPPISGKCNACGGKLLLTVNRGGVEKYLKVSMEMIARYSLPNYLKQRFMLLEKDIESIFEDETTKQFNLEEFM